MLRAIEGFDLYANAAQMVQRAGYLQWPYVSSSSLSLNPLQDSGNELLIAAGDTGTVLSGSFGGNIQTGFMGFRMLTRGSLTFQLMDTFTNTVQEAIKLDSADGSVQSVRNGRSDNNVIPVNTKLFIEIGWVAAKNGGTIVVRANGKIVGHFFGNTAPGDNAWVNGVNVLSLGSGDKTLDDFYVADTTADPVTPGLNTFIGDHRIYPLFVNGPGGKSDWTPGGAADPLNWRNVTLPRGDGAYNETLTVGAEDLFTLSALPSTVSAVTALHVVGSYRKTDTFPSAITQRLNSNGSEGVGENRTTVPTTYVFYSDMFTADPNTGAAWTVAALDPGKIKVGYHRDA